MNRETYSFVKLKGKIEPFASSKLKDIQLKQNRYWQFNETRYLLHWYQSKYPINQESFFFDEDILSPVRFHGQIPSWTFSYLQKGELFALSFAVGENYRKPNLQQKHDQLQDLVGKRELSLLEQQEFLGLMEELMTNSYGVIHFIDVKKKHQFADILFRIYANGCIEVFYVDSKEGCEEEHISSYVLSFMSEVCKYFLIGDTQSYADAWSEIKFNEKEKIDHPLGKAHDLLEELFKQGQHICNELGIGIEERELILTYLLKETKSFKDNPYLYEDEKHRLIYQITNRWE